MLDVSHPPSSDTSLPIVGPSDHDKPQSDATLNESRPIGEPVEVWKRFKGTPRDFKRVHRDGLDALESLNRVDSADLSMHLYNAHSLKRRLYSKQQDGRNVKSHYRKERWRGTDDEEMDGEPSEGWVPHRTWTAWPLEPDRLPQLRGMAGLTTGNVADLGDLRPLKRALRPSQELEDCLLSEVLRQARETFREFHPPDDRWRRTHLLEQKATLSGEPADKVPSSPPAEDGSVRPCIMSDEEEARAIAQPVIRHIISQFEDLLRSLSLSRLNQQPHSASNLEGEGRSGEESSEVFPRLTSRRRLKREAIGRDWSEVLGLAATTGWDLDVVKQAVSRCSALLGESMNFTILPEDPGRQELAVDAHLASETEIQEPSELDLNTLRCPIEDCARHTVPYATRWRLNEHMVRSHGREDSSKSPSPPPTERHDDMIGGVHIDGFLQPIEAAGHFKAPRNYVRQLSGTNVSQRRPALNIAKHEKDEIANEEDLHLTDELFSSPSAEGGEVWEGHDTLVISTSTASASNSG